MLLLYFFVLFVVNTLAYPLQLSNEINDMPIDGPDLTYLGDRVFGKPNENVGDKLKNWNANNASENPEELGEYVEGDILFPQRLRNGLVAQTSRWIDGVVPFVISGSFSTNDIETIEKAMKIYHKYTCVKFRKRLPTDNDYLEIVNGNSGCWSSVGRIGGRQIVNLQSPSCTTKIGTPIHELMHAIGFLHEQNRWERDDYVTIVWGNIKKGHEGNFKKASKDTTNGFGINYDYRSVMHYSPTAFSVNGKSTIIPKDSSKKTKMGQRDGFSRGDILKINAMYGCPDKVPPNSTNTDENNNNNNSYNSNNNNNNNGLDLGILSFFFQ